MLLRIARILLADVYWTDEREEMYHVVGGHERDIMKRPETPPVPDELHAVMRLALVCGRIEQAWGESFYSIARRICQPDQTFMDIQEELVYLTLMACIGHGIGPGDSSCEWPSELEEAPIQIENPMQWQLDE